MSKMKGSSDRSLPAWTICSILILAALAGSIPYSIHRGYEGTGVQRASSKVNVQSLSEWVLRKAEVYGMKETAWISNLESRYPDKFSAYLVPEQYPDGILLRPESLSLSWKVDWNSFPFLPSQVEEFGIGTLQGFSGPLAARLASIELWVAYSEPRTVGDMIFYTFMGLAIFGPIVVWLLLTLILRKRRLWHVLIVIWIYSFQLLISSYLASRDPFHESGMMDYPGYAFFLLPIAMYLVRRFELGGRGSAWLESLAGTRHRFFFEPRRADSALTDPKEDE